jgi:hypothetical protein
MLMGTVPHEESSEQLGL